MDVSDAVERLHRAHARAGLGRVERPDDRVETVLAEIAAAVAPLRLPADLLALWRSVDPDTLAVGPSPRPAGPELSLRLWREHLARRPDLARLFPWCYESHDFILVELDGPGSTGGGCYSWTFGSAPVVRTFTSVAAYVDLLATMIELGEFTYHPLLGVLEFDPDRRWTDAQLVRLASDGCPPATGPAGSTLRSAPTTVAALREAAARGQSPSGLVCARVLSLSGSASGARIQVTDGTGRLDVWCPASLCGNGPVIDHRLRVRPDPAPRLPARGRRDRRPAVRRAGHPPRRPADGGAAGHPDLRPAVPDAGPGAGPRYPARRLRASRGQSRTARSASARNAAGTAVSRLPSRPAG